MPFVPLPFDTDSDALASGFDDATLWAAPFGLRLLEALEPGHNLRLLDIGTGTGFPLLEAAMQLGDTCDAHGIDPWKAGLRRTQQKIEARGLKNISLYEGVAEQLPFPDAHFDRIISNNGLNNVSDMRQAFREVARVSRSGAQLVFTMNTADTFREFYMVLLEIMQEKNIAQAGVTIARHIGDRRKPLPKVERWIADAGLRVVHRSEDQFSFRYTDGTALFAHYFTRLAFLGGWLEIVPEALREEVFEAVEQRLNAIADPQEGLSLGIPFVTYACRKP